jgi:hypothetical protein
MKGANKWLRPEDHCCLPSPKLHLTRVAGLVFNFSTTAIPQASSAAEPSTADDSTTEPSQPPRRRRPTSAGADDPAYERASAR